MRVLFLSPGHPSLQPGGTEFLAHQLFRTLRDHHGVDGLLLAAVDSTLRPPLAGTRLQPPGSGAPPDELLVSLACFDRFHLLQPDALGLVSTLGPILQRMRPDIVHLHHPLQWGVETLDLLRRLAPQAALVVTLHDYFALCPREGQLLTADDRLCLGASQDGCRSCLPDRSASELALRQTHLEGALRGADMLIAPSAFLRDRFFAAGWQAERVALLPNGIRDVAAVPHRPTTDGRRDRFAMFGQLNRFKGVLVALRASARLSAAGVVHRLDLHGPVARSSPAFVAEFEAALAAAPAARHHGPYWPETLPRLMQSADWVLVPSIWWENAPLVVMEAHAHRRPVICTGIGGMAELVEAGVGGFHADRNDPAHWAQTLAAAIAEEGAWERLVRSIPPPRDIAAVADEHMRLYRTLLARRAPPRRRRAA